MMPFAQWYEAMLDNYGPHYCPRCGSGFAETDWYEGVEGDGIYVTFDVKCPFCGWQGGVVANGEDYKDVYRAVFPGES